MDNIIKIPSQFYSSNILLGADSKDAFGKLIPPKDFENSSRLVDFFLKRNFDVYYSGLFAVELLDSALENKYLVSDHTPVSLSVFSKNVEEVNGLIGKVRTYLLDQPVESGQENLKELVNDELKGLESIYPTIREVVGEKVPVYSFRSVWNNGGKDIVVGLFDDKI